jgi:hypothetical protein
VDLDQPSNLHQMIRIGVAVRIPAGAIEDWVKRQVGEDTQTGSRVAGR